METQTLPEIPLYTVLGKEWEKLPEYDGYVPINESWKSLSEYFYSKKRGHTNPKFINVTKANHISYVDVYGFEINERLVFCKVLATKQLVAIAF